MAVSVKMTDLQAQMFVDHFDKTPEDPELTPVINILRTGAALAVQKEKLKEEALLEKNNDDLDPYDM